MHFHDSFIAHFFSVLSLSCCHKQTFAVLLLFIIHKSNKVASQDNARRHFRAASSSPPQFLPITSFVHIHFVSFVSRIRLISSRLPLFSPTLYLSAPSVCVCVCIHIKTIPRHLAAFVDTFVAVFFIVPCANKICQPPRVKTVNHQTLL